jgi:hypothetical protein
MKKLIFVIPFLLWASICQAAVYHVAASGGDYATIAQVNAATFQPGDFVLFNQGETFTGKLIFPSEGTVGSVITIGKYGTGANPIIDANNANTRCISLVDKSYITIDGVDCKNATATGICGEGAATNIIIQNLTVSAIGTANAVLPGINGNSHWTITHCTITNIAQAGIELAGGNNVVTYNDISYTNTVYTGWGAGIHIQPVTAADDNTEIAYNTIHDNGGVGELGLTHGIYVGTGATNQNIHHNTITNSSRGAGINFAGSGSAHHNYISGSYSGGIHTGTEDYSTTLLIYNNIFTGNHVGVWNTGQDANALTLSIYHNTFYLNNNTVQNAYPVEIKIDTDINTSLIIENNIIYATANRYAYQMVSQSHATINNNCLYQTAGSLISYNDSNPNWATWQGYGFDTAGLNVDPLLTSAYYLKSGSPCTTSGVGVGITDDKDGNPRTNYFSMGAYQFGTFIHSGTINPGSIQ